MRPGLAVPARCRHTAPSVLVLNPVYSTLRRHGRARELLRPPLRCARDRRVAEACDVAVHIIGLQVRAWPGRVVRRVHRSSASVADREAQPLLAERGGALVLARSGAVVSPHHQQLDPTNIQIDDSEVIAEDVSVCCLASGFALRHPAAIGDATHQSATPRRTHVPSFRPLLTSSGQRRAAIDRAT